MQGMDLLAMACSPALQKNFADLDSASLNWAGMDLGEVVRADYEGQGESTLWMWPFSGMHLFAEWLKPLVGKFTDGHRVFTVCYASYIEHAAFVSYVHGWGDISRHRTSVFDTLGVVLYVCGNVLSISMLSPTETLSVEVYECNGFMMLKYAKCRTPPEAVLSAGEA